MLCLLVLLTILLNSARAAVSVTKPQACGLLEEFRRCGPAESCVPTCDNLGDEVCCVSGCNEGCFCVDGYIRDPQNKCVASKDCPSAGSLKFEKLELTIFENQKIAKLTVLRVNGSHGRITVRWRVVTSALPYSTLTGLLVFEDGLTVQTIEIPLVDNDIRDLDITLNVELYEPSRKTGLEPRGGRSKIIIKDDDMRPGYPEMDQLSLSVKESDKSVSVRVVRVGGTDGRLTAHWKAVSGTAEVEKDFAESSGKLVFEEGEKEQIIKIEINDDEDRESKEQFRVEIYDPSVDPGVLNFRNLGSKLSTIVTIEDDDMTPGYPEMPTRELRVKEGAGTVSIKVVREGGEDGTILVRYRIKPVSALFPVDYLALPADGVLVFAEGVTEQTIIVIIVDDNEREKDERFQVELYDPEPGLGTLKFRNKEDAIFVTDVIIEDNDMQSGYLELEKTVETVPEGSKKVEIFVKRLGGVDGQVSVFWQTRAGTGANAAKETLDFVPDKGELVFLEGENRKSFVVDIVDDDIRENQEEFIVDIFNASAAKGVLNFRKLGQQVFTKILIIDDDMNGGKLVLERSTIDVLENSGKVNLVVNRVDGTDGPVSVHWRTIGEGSFFVVDQGTLEFQDGESKKSIEIRIIDNTLRNKEKRSFQVELFDPKVPAGVNFRGFGDVTRVTINVNDDDGVAGELQLSQNSSFSIINGVPTVSVTILRVNGSDGVLFVKWRTVSTVPSFVPATGVVIFNDQQKEQTIQIPKPLADFKIELLDPSPGQDGVHFRGLTSESSTLDIKFSSFFGTLSLEEQSYTITENVGKFTIGILREGNTNVPIRVQWRITPGTAQLGEDFEAEVKDIEFAPNQHLQFISIRIVDDSVREPELETFEVELLNVITADGIGFNGIEPIRKAVVTIVDDDRRPGVIAFTDDSVVAWVGRNVTLKVVRTEGSDGIVMLHWRSTDSATTREGIDYVGGRGTLTFDDGQTEQQITLQILPGDGSGAERRFTIGLFDPTSGARLGSLSLITIIITGEAKPQGPLIFFWNNTLEVARDAEFVFFQIRRTQDGIAQTFLLETLQFNGLGAALPKVDFTPVRGFLTFAPNAIALTSRVKLIPNPSSRALFKIFLLRISKPDVGGTVPGGDFMTVLLKDVGALSWKGPEVQQPTSVEVSHSVQTEIQPPPPPQVEFRGGVRVENEQNDGLKCPEGRTFKKCQPRCQKKCGEGSPSVPVCTKRGCVDGCFCPDGMLLDTSTNKCVEPAQCPQPKCPPGLTFKECEPACQEVCPGLTLDLPCGKGGCFPGCFCPRGLVLDNSLRNCVDPALCPSASQSRGSLTGGLPTGAIQGQVQMQGGGGLLGGLLG